MNGAADPEISVIAPAFDEESCIEGFVAEVHEALQSTGRQFELLCVNDGSSDGTAVRLQGLRERYPLLRPLSLDEHCGQSAALAAGVAVSRGVLLVLMDADLQNDPADVPHLLARMDREPGLAGIVGVRVSRCDNWVRRLSSTVANRCAGMITGDRVRDAGCGLKVFRAAVLKRVRFFEGAHRFLPTLVRMEGGHVAEVPVSHRPRRHGRSKYGLGLGRTLTALHDALGVRWMMERKREIRVSDPAGAKTTNPQ
jgi:dolichol-phosphate mannosyltransferase